MSFYTAGLSRLETEEKKKQRCWSQVSLNSPREKLQEREIWIIWTIEIIISRSKGF